MRYTKYVTSSFGSSEYTVYRFRPLSGLVSKPPRQVEETQEDDECVQHARRPPLPLHFHDHGQLLLLALHSGLTLAHHASPQPLPAPSPPPPEHDPTHVDDVTAKLSLATAGARCRCDGTQSQHGRGRCEHVFAILRDDDVMRLATGILHDDVIAGDVSVDAGLPDERALGRVEQRLEFGVAATESDRTFRHADLPVRQGHSHFLLYLITFNHFN